MQVPPLMKDTTNQNSRDLSGVTTAAEKKLMKASGVETSSHPPSNTPIVERRVIKTTYNLGKMKN